MIDRYQQLFDTNKSKSGILVPFFMLGDFSETETLEWVDMLIENGANALELGMPFSDPVADGPVIQKAAIKALARGTNPDVCFKLITAIRKKHPLVPMGLLTYANLVVVKGIKEFYAQAQQSGLDSILLADIPVHAIEVFKTMSHKYGIHQVLIATPNATEQQIEKIAKKSSGYTYVVSRSGVTGTDLKSGLPTDTLKRIKSFQAPPALLGFGISQKQDVVNAMVAGFDGVICGSALVHIQHQYDNKERLIKGAQLMQLLKRGLID